MSEEDDLRAESNCIFKNWKDKNPMTKKTKILWRIIRAITALIPPIVFTFYLFSPFERIELELQPNEEKYIPQSAINSGLAKKSIADFFQTTLNLGWYRICLENNHALMLERSPDFYRNKESEESMRGTLSWKIVEVNNENSRFTNEKEHMLMAKPGQTDCSTLSGHSEGIRYMPGSLTAIVGRGEDLFSQGEEVGTSTYKIGFEIRWKRISLTLRNDPWAIIVRGGVIFVLWNSFVLLFLSLLKFVICGSEIPWRKRGVKKYRLWAGIGDDSGS